MPGKGQVVIDVKAAEINYPDILVISGQYQIKPPLPFAPGKAAAGIVSAVGAGVTDLKVGDRVAAQVEYGAFAEKLLAAAVNVFPHAGGDRLHQGRGARPRLPDRAFRAGRARPPAQRR